MTKARQFFETFNLALGRLVALIVGAVGVLALYISWEAWGSSGAMVAAAIGIGLIVLATAMLYWRVTILGIVEFFSQGFISN